MQFYDVNRRDSYSSFLAQAKHTKPYRDSGNAYPLGDRRYSHRHWRLRPDGTITLHYIHRESQDKYETQGTSSYPEWHDKRKLATVYPDSTFSIHHTRQGDNEMLGEVFGIRLFTDKSRGGIVMDTRRYGLVPLFAGNRFTMGDVRPVVSYQVFQRRLNRKLAAEAMAEYQDFLNVAPVMIDQMDFHGLRDVGLHLEHTLRKDPDEHPWNIFQSARTDEMFFKLVKDKHYVDAALLFGMSHSRTSGLSMITSMKGESNWPYLDTFKRQLKETLPEKLKEVVYYRHNTFDMKELPPGELPSSRWQHRVTVNGEPVQRI